MVNSEFDLKVCELMGIDPAQVHDITLVLDPAHLNMTMTIAFLGTPGDLEAINWGDKLPNVSINLISPRASNKPSETKLNFPRQFDSTYTPDGAKMDWGDLPEDLKHPGVEDGL